MGGGGGRNKFISSLPLLCKPQLKATSVMQMLSSLYFIKPALRAGPLPRIIIFKTPFNNF